MNNFFGIRDKTQKPILHEKKDLVLHELIAVELPIIAVFVR